MQYVIIAIGVAYIPYFIRLTRGEMLSVRTHQYADAAISVGKVDGELLVDLDYEEDSTAEADLNLVMNGAGEYIEIQASAEHGTLNKAELTQALKLGEQAILELMEMQRRILADLGMDGQIFKVGSAS